MKNYKKHIDDFFREKLGRYTETPPADVWESLDVRLDTLTPTITGPGSTPYKWLWHMGMVSVIAVLTVSLVHKYTGEKTTEASRSNEQIAQVAPATPNTLNAAPSTADAKAVNVDAVPVAGDNAQAEATSNNAQSVNVQAPATDNSSPANKTGAKQVSVSTQHVNSLKHTGTKTYASTGANNSFAAKTQPANVYNSSAPENNAYNEPGEQTAATINQTAIASNVIPAATSNPTQQNVPGTFKKDASVAEKKAAVKPVNDKKHKLPADFNRWEAGIKAGYERGFDNAAASKFAIAPYIQYNLSPKFAVMVQPAVKFASSQVRKIGADEHYYQVNDDGKATQNGQSDRVSSIEGGTTVYNYHTSYTFTQSHDSIVKSNTYGGRYMEYELPILLKYNITDKAAVYGGVNMIYSQTKGVTEHTYTKQGIVTKIDSTFITAAPPTSLPPVSDIINTNGAPFINGSPYTNYHGPLYPNAQENEIRFGAMLGFSYEYNRKWIFDALIQQNPARADMRSGYNINTPLSSTYFRLSVGYKLTK